MIRNWTVVTQATKSIIAREKYLSDTEHKNHVRTENIINIYGSDSNSFNILRNCERYKLKAAKKRKGGRPPSEAVEFVFALPKALRPTQQEWRSMLNIVMRNLANHLDIPTTALASITRAVVHQQNQDINLKGAGDHMHLICGKFSDDLQYLRDLQRKSVTRLMKTTFNMAVLEVMNVDHNTYVAEKTYAGKAKKRTATWKVKAARKKEEFDLREKALNRIIDQAKKWLSAYDKNNLRQMNRQYNRISKELDNLESSNSVDINDSMVNLLNSLASQIDSRSKSCNKTPLKEKVASIKSKM